MPPLAIASLLARFSSSFSFPPDAADAEIYAMYASARTSRPGACSGLGCGRWGGGGRRRGETCAKLTHARALCCDFLNAFQAIPRYLSFLKKIIIGEGLEISAYVPVRRAIWEMLNKLTRTGKTNAILPPDFHSSY